MGNASYCDFVDDGIEKYARKNVKSDKINNKKTIATIKESNNGKINSNKDKKKMQMNKMCSIDFGVTFS